MTKILLRTLCLLLVSSTSQAVIYDISMGGEITRNRSTLDMFDVGTTWDSVLRIDTENPRSDILCQYVNACQRGYFVDGDINVGGFTQSSNPTGDSFHTLSPHTGNGPERFWTRFDDFAPIMFSESEFLRIIGIDLRADGGSIFSDPFQLAFDELLDITIDDFQSASMTMFISETPTASLSSGLITGNLTRFSVTAVPAPATLLLMLTGFGILLTRRNTQN